MTISEIVAAGGMLRRGSKDRAAVTSLQIALRGAGHELVADGDFGLITELAVKQFQRAHGLEGDGVVGAQTALNLDGIPKAPAASFEPPLPSSITVAPWLSVGRALTGTKEIDGSQDSPLILGWVKSIVAAYPDLKGTVGWYNHDSIPWCGLFVAYCVAKAGFKPPALALGAVNWARDWSDGVQLHGPALGAVVVMTRTGGGHVTMYEGEDDQYWFGRGGNQGDMVNVARFPKSRPVLGYMWPRAAVIPNIGPVRRSFANAAAAGKES